MLNISGFEGFKASLSLFNLLQEGSFANSVAPRQDICMGKTSLKKVLPGVQI